MNRLQLRPFEREHLPLVEPWFTDGDTRRWLGGPDWPRLMLDRAHRPLGEFRGAAETGRYRWLAWDGGTAVGYIDCGTYDRWATWEGGPGGRGVIGVIDLPTGSINYVVDPALRRRGYCAAMVTALLAMPELAGIEMFAAGVEPANASSVGCLRKAGFRPLDPEPDWEGVVYYCRLRHPVTAEPHDRTASPCAAAARTVAGPAGKLCGRSSARTKRAHMRDRPGVRRWQVARAPLSAAAQPRPLLATPHRPLPARP